MVQRYTILIVDDERSLVNLLKSELESSERFQVDIAHDGAQAINKLQSTVYDIVLLDVRMPRVGGIEVLKYTREQCPSTQVIILTNYANIKTAIETIKLGAYDFIAKPYDYDELVAAIERAIERRKLSIDNELMRNELYLRRKNLEIIGRSKMLQEVIDRSRKVAETDSIVLIHGASGTGKELIANLIHRSSERGDRPFVVVNCASIPDTLLESELFGHERGAFTNAYSTKQGLAEVAHGGSLFLDEVGDISPSIQPKLLRFLEAGEFRRVGGTHTLKANVRIISATNKNLEDEVKKGRFREDLLYRLNVVTINVPPLKDRKEDIPLLVDHFLSMRSKSRTPKKLSPEALEVLINYDWHGNVRELEHVIEGAIILSAKDTIYPEDLVLNSIIAKSIENPVHNNKLNSAQPTYENTSRPLSLEDLEKIHIKRTLESNDWNRTKTAEVLGITPKTLYLKIKKFGIKQPD